MSIKSVAASANERQYKVRGRLWNVGPRYILHEHVGGGSYGDVCRATDLETHQTVALKRVPDVLCCPLLAKRVLREVCIMRRLSHPHVILLTDVFTYPSLESQDGLDLYIATEFADGGDIYHLKTPVSISDVKLLLWQLLAGVKYLHSCRVWHRDIKSENILLRSGLHVKICDFGLSRSAEEDKLGFEVAQISVNGKTKPANKALTRQYTKMVVTPSYRAPEVIMSRGQYNSTIDIWSIGCIFWELLMRSINRQNRGVLANPLFGVCGEPITPEAGEKYAKDAYSPLAEQLDVIFDVIGTPCWKDIEGIPSQSWRAYLMGLPGRAGNLTKNLIGRVDDDAIDLLTRMLAFDPARRCTAEEALSHAYFKSMNMPADSSQAVSEDLTSAIATGSLWKIRDPSNALAQIERELESSERDVDGGRNKLIFLLTSEIQQQQQQNLMQRSLLCSLATAKLQLLQQREMITLAPHMIVVNQPSAATPSQTLMLAPLQSSAISCKVETEAATCCACDFCAKPQGNTSTVNDIRGAKKVQDSRGSLQMKLSSQPDKTESSITNLDAQPKRARGSASKIPRAPVPVKYTKIPWIKVENTVDSGTVNVSSTTSNDHVEINFFPRRSPRFREGASLTIS
ncbi:hypothetical protein KP509_01G007600 [Ceratopteris richardii]|uniref:Protein kinase domain-containing protein n=1 Tax=Ceratopteris richardii TaxID=49495 RepID=A0A8T2VA88_CERRI|nr:hypothetical protein KP509_01G007600 [Ceratopteris richardii]